jgi:hypothetical protein
VRHDLVVQNFSAGGWRWSRPVLTWQDAEQMAADHMRHLRFTGVTVSPSGRDGGLDVISHAGAAQVKFHVAPTGGPEVQKLRGAADPFAARLFYATGFTPAAFTAGDALGVAMLQFTVEGDVVAANGHARSLVTLNAPQSPA